jgi:ribose 5-phosphate isomerase A
MGGTGGIQGMRHCLSVFVSNPAADNRPMNKALTQDELKAQVGYAALDYVRAHMRPGQWVGVGTGSTVNHFIDALAVACRDAGLLIAGAVSSSHASTLRLRACGITVVDAAEIDSLPLYVDGADEIDGHGFMIKGGGAALTREKIVADLARQFVCIVDQSKRVDVLGRYPLPVEVIDMAAPQLTRRFAALGGEAVMRMAGEGAQRQAVLTDNGHPLLDVRGLRITDPLALEVEINQWPGVVSVGLFARHRAQLCLLGTPQGVQTVVF